jgi:hypothetical protein
MKKIEAAEAASLALPGVAGLRPAVPSPAVLRCAGFDHISTGVR